MAYINGKQIMNVTVHITPTEIQFTVDGQQLTAMYGMTWGEWCNSSYNTIGAHVDEYGEISNDGGNIAPPQGNICAATDRVISDGIYTTV